MRAFMRVCSLLCNAPTNIFISLCFWFFHTLQRLLRCDDVHCVIYLHMNVVTFCTREEERKNLYGNILVYRKNRKSGEHWARSTNISAVRIAWRSHCIVQVIRLRMKFWCWFWVYATRIIPIDCCAWISPECQNYLTHLMEKKEGSSYSESAHWYLIIQIQNESRITTLYLCQYLLAHFPSPSTI